MKGADSIIIARLSQNNQRYLDNANVKLSEYSLIGLRTLCISMRILSRKELEQFTEAYQKLGAQANRAEMIRIIVNLSLPCGLV